MLLLLMMTLTLPHWLLLLLPHGCCCRALLSWSMASCAGWALLTATHQVQQLGASCATLKAVVFGV
jgi:hypothetical protein